ncbi:hypothetical protein JVB16_13865 [Enterobacter hormaechei]|uniref:hypothetical protein n=1 Tax=Enterobacter TaxID=547 RepID=UPI00147213BE|nr:MULTISPECIES: hypothetical protein [Enterobacter]MBU5665134.1 hypothetical protein [Enterobacteriaceae bacterium S32_ASV_15]HBM2676246.1 hypothetical protein [Enterobacter hormaechei subsp. xiangfangensis]EHF4989771.1 hypothetical protein [Enterobacter hormaechei]MBW7724148.1 hypothetical protein [Enterobacter hormaechei]MCE1309507.1 hypothetical protein [Enterobacter hormaechei]
MRQIKLCQIKRGQRAVIIGRRDVCRAAGAFTGKPGMNVAQQYLLVGGKGSERWQAIV